VLHVNPSSLIALRYAILGVLGRGGMATVYRARHIALGREVALKLLPPQVFGGDRAARFEREARHAARLDHPSCVRVLDYGTCVDGSRYLAMELVEGPTLRSQLASGTPCRYDIAAWVGAELCDALAHAHAAGVIHRDVKPENVMFAPIAEAGPGESRTGWRVVLIDFGLSRIADDAPLTALGACVGSPSYLAPERALGDDGDGRSDLYAVGVILYELLSGRRPFIGDTPAATARLHVHAAPAPLTALVPDLPPALAAVVHRALAKEPAARFPDAAAMGRALRAACPALHRPITSAPTPRAVTSSGSDALTSSGETTWIRLDAL